MTSKRLLRKKINLPLIGNDKIFAFTGMTDSCFGRFSMKGIRSLSCHPELLEGFA
jgi:hypothetical protein